MPIILVADDSLSVRKVAERMLTEAGLEVVLAANGEEAMSVASSKKPDLVIADVIMPDKSGFEVCAYIRAQAVLTNTPVLLVSGFVDDEVTRQAEACKADGVIKKPFQGAMLRERVMELLASRKAPAAPAAVAAPELVLEMPAIEMPAIEMPAVAAPEPAIALHVPPPSPAPAPVAMAAPTAPVAMPALQLAGEVRTLQETIQRLEGRIAEQGKGLVHLEQQMQTLQGAGGGGQQVEALQKRLAEQESRNAQLEQSIQASRESAAQAITLVQKLEARLAELEPAVASAKQLLHALAEFARQTIIKP
ncbi:MAG: response regulator [Nitrospirae bacterium]|nr:MAG: response regulator [Nitrospirota bacterium]